MCRSSKHGGRRCPGSNTTRTRALNTARKQVERANRRLDAARATGDSTAIQAAETRLIEARQRLADTYAAHPRTSQERPMTEKPAEHRDMTAPNGQPQPEPAARTENTTVIHHAEGPISTGTETQINVYDGNRQVTSTTIGSTGPIDQAAYEARRQARATERAARAEARAARKAAKAQGHWRQTSNQPPAGTTIHHLHGPAHFGSGNTYTSEPE
ncbi:hypothetical protein [Amycolatopsis granulosa]|uniref:hypothetical protein n=1 Tax=Amycolatopsis granulosa TaxID=185684 RepID=UPI00141ED8A2|nr:hypothetical protein [Amycolatopsis granulosa]NIH85775.1 septal ring factor EnvC (AmiA/AmiB activator) [Amycolatopsis granulosa]